MRLIRASMSSSAATATWQLQAGHHLDVVDREDVGRVGHRQQQRLGVDVADRHRLVAARGGHREQVRRPHVDLVDVEVDVVEPVALGDRARELVAVDHLVVAQQRLGRLAGHPRLVDHLVDPLAASRSRGRRSTSVTNIPEWPRCIGAVRPLPACASSASSSCRAVASPRRGPVSGIRVGLRLPCVRSDGPPHHLDRGFQPGPDPKRGGPLVNQHLEPVDDAAPPRSCRADQLRSADP